MGQSANQPWSHKDAMFFRSSTRVLQECMRLADERGAEYDAHSDSFMEAPSIFLPQVESREWEDASVRRAAIRVAVLTDVKIQRIVSGLAKEDSYLDLINYLSVLTSLMFHDQDHAGSTLNDTIFPGP